MNDITVAAVIEGSSSPRFVIHDEDRDLFTSCHVFADEESAKAEGRALLDSIRASVVEVSFASYTGWGHYGILSIDNFPRAVTPFNPNEEELATDIERTLATIREAKA